MSKIVMIGAGSAGFCRTLVQDILCFESLQDSHIVLFDVDAERLKTTYEVMQHIEDVHMVLGHLLFQHLIDDIRAQP